MSPSPAQIRRRRRAALAVLALVGIGAIYLILTTTVFGPVDTHGTRVEHFTVHSKAVGRDLGVSVVVPARHSEKPPLLVFLHGRSGSDRTFTEDEAMFKALAGLGRRAPIVAFPTAANTATGTTGQKAAGAPTSCAK